MGRATGSGPLSVEPEGSFSNNQPVRAAICVSDSPVMFSSVLLCIPTSPFPFPFLFFLLSNQSFTFLFHCCLCLRCPFHPSALCSLFHALSFLSPPFISLSAFFLQFPSFLLSLHRTSVFCPLFHIAPHPVASLLCHFLIFNLHSSVFTSFTSLAYQMERFPNRFLSIR